jgi:hypothetical protein
MLPALVGACASAGARRSDATPDAAEPDENVAPRPLPVTPGRERGFTFAGIAWGTPADSVVARLTKLGYVRITRTADGDIEFQGAALVGQPTIGHAGITQGVLAKISIEVVTDSLQARTIYGVLRDGLIRESGPPDDTMETAAATNDSLRSGGASMLIVWGGARHGSQSTMSLEITPELTVALEYEWSAWAVEYERRGRRGQR